MKNITKILVVLAIAFMLATPASHASAENQIATWEEYFPWSHWMPDDVGGVYFDNTNGVFCILVLNSPTPEREEQLITWAQERYELCDGDTSIAFIPCKYSHNELMQIFYEICLRMVDEDAMIWIVGIMDSENRVNITVDKQKFDYYSAEFAELYRDKVFVEIGSPIVPAIRVSNNSYILWIGLILATGLSGIIAFMIWRRGNPTFALQTAHGNIATSCHVSRKQAFAAVKDSESTPSSALFASIMQKIQQNGS